MTKPELAPIGSHLLAAARRFQDRTFMRHADGRALSYGEAARRVAATLGLFRELGIERGDRILSYSDQKMEPALFFISCAAAGILPVPLHPEFSLRFVARLAETVNARRTFTTLDLVDGVIAQGLPALVYGPFDGACDAVESDSKTLAESLETLAAACAQIELEDAVVIQQTSGSTGHSKLVLRKHMSMARYPKFFAPILVPDGIEEQKKLLHVQSLTTTGGLNWLTIGVAIAAEILVTTVTDKDASIQEVLAHEPELIWMTPRILTGLRRSYEAEYGKLTPDSHLFGPRAETMMIGGARPDVPLLSKLEASGLSVHDFYGSTEGSLIAMTPRGENGWKHGWTGQLLPDVEMREHDDGELLLYNPGLMLCYLGDEDLTREALTADGYFRTGDRGEVDGHRNLRIEGRKKELFNTQIGTYIDPRYIENLLEEIPGVHQAVLYGHNLPYITAYLSVHGLEGCGEPGDGYLDPADCRQLLDKVHSGIREMNRELESIEWVQGFMLFDRPFPLEVYREMPGKTRRSRDCFQELFRARIDSLYPSEGLGPEHPCRVLTTTEPSVS